jgi:hypothetical protein
MYVTINIIVAALSLTYSTNCTCTNCCLHRRTRRIVIQCVAALFPLYNRSPRWHAMNVGNISEALSLG